MLNLLSSLPAALLTGTAFLVVCIWCSLLGSVFIFLLYPRRVLLAYSDPVSLRLLCFFESKELAIVKLIEGALGSLCEFNGSSIEIVALISPSLFHQRVQRVCLLNLQCSQQDAVQGFHLSHDAERCSEDNKAGRCLVFHCLLFESAFAL